jgi:hypothetical protein
VRGMARFASTIRSRIGDRTPSGSSMWGQGCLEAEGSEGFTPTDSCAKNLTFTER